MKFKSLCWCCHKSNKRKKYGNKCEFCFRYHNKTCSKYEAKFWKMPLKKRYEFMDSGISVEQFVKMEMKKELEMKKNPPKPKVRKLNIRGFFEIAKKDDPIKDKK